MAKPKARAALAALSLLLSLAMIAACGSSGAGTGTGEGAQATTQAAAETQAATTAKAQATTAAAQETAAAAQEATTAAAQAETEAQTQAAAVEPETAAPAGAAAGAEGLEPYDLVYYMYSVASSDQAGIVAEAVNKIIGPKLNATVEFVMITGGDWYDKAMPALRAGERIDIFWTPEWMGYTSNISTGSLLALDDPDGPFGDLINTYAPDTVAELGYFIDANRVNGYLYGVATNKELVVPSGWVWNETLVEKYGIDISQYLTLADLEPVLASFKETEEYAAGTYPLLLTGLTSTALPQFVQGFMDGMAPITMYIGDPGARDGEPIVIWDTPEMQEYLPLMKRYMESGYLHPDSHLNTFTSIDHLNAGDFLVTADYVLHGGQCESKELMAASGNPDLRLVELQNGPNVIVTTHAGGSMLGIPITSDDPPRAMMFINEMHQNAEMLNVMTWGVEGVHYDMEGDFVQPRPKNGWSDSHGGVWTLGNQFKQMIAVGEDPDKYNQMLALTEVAFPHESLGFRFERENYENEYVAVANVLTAYERPMAVGLNTEDFDKFRAELDRAGLQTVLDAARQSYAQWKQAEYGGR